MASSEIHELIRVLRTVLRSDTLEPAKDIVARIQKLTIPEAFQQVMANLEDHERELVSTFCKLEPVKHRGRKLGSLGAKTRAVLDAPIPEAQRRPANAMAARIGRLTSDLELAYAVGEITLEEFKALGGTLFR